jgi:hypothetical protein
MCTLLLGKKKKVGKGKKTERLGASKYSLTFSKVNQAYRF